MHPTRPSAPILATIFGIVLLAACAPAPRSGPASQPASSSESARPVASVPEVATAPPSQAASVGEVPDDILDRVLADARTQLGTDDLDVLVGEAVTWPDGSLGCPEPGMMYTQALVDGYQIVVSDGTTELDYRVGAGGGFRICTTPRPRG